MSAPRRLALLLAYDGSGFHGFQRQPGFPTVQEELERAWTAVTGERAVVHGSGRTDTGVHAWGQVAHLDTWSGLAVERFRPALNAYLPDEMVVRAVAQVPAEFHARESAVAKRYGYLLAVGESRPVLRAGKSGWDRAASLDLAAMRAGARLLLGTHDFSAFAAAGRTTRTSTRTLRAVHLRRLRGGLLLAFEADGFLYRQVRNMVGALQEVGRGRRGPEWIGALLRSRDRRQGAATAPPQGLYLWRVRYPADPFRDPIRG